MALVQLVDRPEVAATESNEVTDAAASPKKAKAIAKAIKAKPAKEASAEGKPAKAKAAPKAKASGAKSTDE